MWKKLLLLLFLAVLERAGVPVALALPYVVANLAVYAAEDKTMFPFAFAAGLVVDVVFLNTLGVSSIALLLARGILVFLQNRLGRELWWVMMMVAFCVSLMSEWWSGDGWRWVYALSAGIVVLGWYGVVARGHSLSRGVFVGR